MGEKDILEKVLMSHADVFADCVNALAYGGKGKLAEADLQPAPTENYLNEDSFENRSGQPIRHVEELCSMMETLTGDTRFTELMEELLARKAEKEEVYMCEYIDMLEARGEKRGKKIGEEIGEKKGENRLAELIGRLCKEGKYKEIEAVSADRVKRQELYRLYNIT